MSGLMFRPELAAKVMAGEKTVTRRIANDRPASPWYHLRAQWPETIAVQPGRSKPAIGRAWIVSARLERLGYAFGRTLDVDDHPPGADNEARAEGFRDAGSFKVAWVAINGGYDPLTLVWRVELEAVR